MGKLSAKICASFEAKTIEYDPCAVETARKYNADTLPFTAISISIDRSIEIPNPSCISNYDKPFTVALQERRPPTARYTRLPSRSDLTVLKCLLLGDELVFHSHPLRLLRLLVKVNDCTHAYFH